MLGKIPSSVFCRLGSLDVEASSNVLNVGFSLPGFGGLGTLLLFAM